MNERVTSIGVIVISIMCLVGALVHRISWGDAIGLWMVGMTGVAAAAFISSTDDTNDEVNNR